jgi:AcrR family transcriptional regulator
VKSSRIDVGRIRREEIVEAAVSVIDEKGLQCLSLREIETKAGMSRGQLTYYFPAKEDILLAVFDRLLDLMQQRIRSAHELGGCPFQEGEAGWERVRKFLNFFVLHPPDDKEFHSLQYTFLSQIMHREDFRQRLASLYEEWRQHLAADMEAALVESNPEGKVSARTVATLVQAILHGLAMQRAADPGAYDRQEMLTLCLKLLGDYLKPATPPGRTSRRAGNGQPVAEGSHT